MGGALLQEELFSTGEDEREPEVYVNVGGGADSGAMTARFLLEPQVRTFDLERVTFLHAVVGRDDEYASTQDALNNALLPLMAEHGARLVQVARAGSSTADGYLILDDSRAPQRIVREAAVWSLYDFHLRRAIVPMVSATKRDCSAKAKHFALDGFIQDEIGPCRRFRQLIGFEVTEAKRIKQDLAHATRYRQPEHPLADWGWDRKDCKDYLYQKLGVKDFPRSCCGYCPFSFRVRDPSELVARWRAEPKLAARSLWLEFVALTANPTAMLYSRHSAIDFATDWRMAEALARFEHKKASEPWRMYAVRRLWQSPGHANRSIRSASDVVTREIAQELVRGAGGTTVRETDGFGTVREHRIPARGTSYHFDRFGIHRTVIRPRSEAYPSLEYSLVAAPAVIEAFEVGNFARAYDTLDPHAAGVLTSA